MTPITHHPPAAGVLFISEQPLWPLDQGFRVHGYHMATALAQREVTVNVASVHPCPNDAPAALKNLLIDWPTTNSDDVKQFRAGWAGALFNLRHKLAEHQTLDVQQLAGIIPLVKQCQPQMVIGLGQHSPIMLRGLRTNSSVGRIWYAADEPVYFHLSCLRRDHPYVMPHRLRKMALYATLEALFVRGLEGAIGVSPLDSQLLRIVAGARRTITIRNGVDLDYFNPQPPNTNPLSPNTKSLIFWGCMDFEPNVDAVCWFAQKVWPKLRCLRPDATWQIVGKNPSPRVTALNRIPGIEVVGQVEDIRPYVHAAAVTIIPTRCGGGIKNKLLEAAAMARPILVSPRAIRGLDLSRGDRPVIVARSSQQWVESIRRLWADAPYARRLGQTARRWVEINHSWSAAATTLSHWLATFPNISRPSHQIQSTKWPTSTIANREAA